MLILNQPKGEVTSAYSNRKSKISVWIANKKSSDPKLKLSKIKYEVCNNTIRRID